MLVILSLEELLRILRCSEIWQQTAASGHYLPRRLKFPASASPPIVLQKSFCTGAQKF